MAHVFGQDFIIMIFIVHLTSLNKLGNDECELAMLPIPNYELLRDSNNNNCIRINDPKLGYPALWVSGQEQFKHPVPRSHQYTYTIYNIINICSDRESDYLQVFFFNYTGTQKNDIIKNRIEHIMPRF